MTDPLLVQNPLPWTVRFTPGPSFVNDRCYELLDADGGTILCGYCPDLLHFIAETSRHFGILERLCQQVREANLATGHADTPEELMAEVLGQVKELREALEKSKRDADAGWERVKALEVEALAQRNMISELGDALGALVNRWNHFTSRSCSGFGNQTDAYYDLAKHAQKDWDRARALLSESTEGE